MPGPIEVLDFWLGDLNPAQWYVADDAVDDAIREHFGELVDALAQDGLEHWVDGPAGTLAYLIVADQFSRNMHRGDARAFATDARARAAARKAVAEGWDLEVPTPEREFFYMPFEHSEELKDQDLAVRMMAERMVDDPSKLLHAHAHRWQIERFGRFPGRNAALGRVNTPEEEAFLAEGGYGALVERLSAE